MFSSRPASRAAYACSSCLRHQPRRLYSSQAKELAPPPPPPSGASKLTNRRLISLHGPEATKFLQGLITNNVHRDSKSGFFAAFLTAQGKVLNDVFIYPTLGSKWHSEANQDDEPGYLVEFDGEDCSEMMKHVKRHKLRAKLAARLLDQDELDVWSVWRGDDRWTAHTQTSSDAGAISLTDCRAPGMGQRILLPCGSSGSSAVGNGADLGDLEEAPSSAYTIRRYLRGVAEGQTEILRGDVLPMNANFDLMGAIDFKKGCYLGQELTIRTHHTGVVRRRILPVSIYQDTPPEKPEYDNSSPVLGVALEQDIKKAGPRERSTGKIIARVGNIGLAMCRLEQMTDLVVSSEGSSFSPDDKFFAQVTGEEERFEVKAYVPDWIRGQIRAPKVQKRVE